MATAAQASRVPDRGARNGVARLGYAFSIAFAIVSNYALYVYFTNLHDGTSVEAMVRSFAAHEQYFRAVTIGLAFATGPIILISGHIAARLWAADPSRNHSLSWIALVADVAFLGAWGAALGLGMAACQLYHYTSAEIVHALFGGFGIIAAMLGILWTPFGIAALVISVRTGLFPRWLNLLTIVATVFNFFAVGGFFTMSGPFNPYNGQIAVGFPFYGLVTWYVMVSAWLMDRRA